MKILHLAIEQCNGFVMALKHAIPLLKSSEAQAWLHELECAIEAAPNLDNIEPVKKEFGPGAGWGKNPHPGDSTYELLTKDEAARPIVPQRLSNAPPASEPGEFDMSLPKVPGG